MSCGGAAAVAGVVEAAVVAASSLGVVTAPLSGRHRRPGPAGDAGDEELLAKSGLSVSVPESCYLQLSSAPPCCLRHGT